MIIKNPGGLKKDKYSNLTTIYTFAKDQDIIINFKLVDGTILVQHIPLKSLRTVSSYSLNKMKHLDNISIFTEADKIAKEIVNFYKNIGIEMSSYEISIIEGE